MEATPKSNRLHIALFGRTNVGKSSFLNLIADQDVAIISPVPGTTTDVVEKSMEFPPLGPVVFLDTAGVDDRSEISGLRLAKTRKIFDRAEVLVLVVEPNRWTAYEEAIAAEASRRKIPVIVIVNKIDLQAPSGDFLSLVSRLTHRLVEVSSVDRGGRSKYIEPFRRHLTEVCPDDFIAPPPLVGDLLRPGGLAVLVVPIDLEAPKGRLILPQVQTTRELLDNNAAALIVKEGELQAMLSRLGELPDLVVCDSQVVLETADKIPPDVPLTTFSILFARHKGNLEELARNAAAIERLEPGDRVLISEACSHHPVEDDIGRVKIPRWLKQYLDCNISIDVYAGRDYPENLADYRLIIHCGGCMLTRREMLNRIQQAVEAGVPVTNYGVAISFLQGVLPRALQPFPDALEAFDPALKGAEKEIINGFCTGGTGTYVG
ncbi:MAG TPA: [FeFe] hydrogenase H-cluster maturation GTPase HydF [Desulfobacteraceae bacterium]|nr:[FeFe] hydrogenase H-cluster maturation GTPase HydF [Desulfobacteraceae bacterium]